MKKILCFLLIAMIVLIGCSQAPVVETQVVTESSPQESAASDADAPISTPSENAVQQSTTEEELGGSSDSAVKEFEMLATRFTFEPNTINVNEGDTVVLHITSADVAHGIAIPEFDVSESLPAGQTVTVEFIADVKGEFPFICNVPCGSGHRGMTGKVVVQ